jgi:hypothetical protein
MFTMQYFEFASKFPKIAVVSAKSNIFILFYQMDSNSSRAFYSEQQRTTSAVWGFMPAVLPQLFPRRPSGPSMA